MGLRSFVAEMLLSGRKEPGGWALSIYGFGLSPQVKGIPLGSVFDGETQSRYRLSDLSEGKRPSFGWIGLQDGSKAC
jgi:hypothetical protein